MVKIDFDKPDSKEQDKKNLGLDVVRVFTKGQTIFGLPSNVFIMGIGISLIIIFFLQKILGIIFLIAYFKTMYSIHEDDPKALEIWISALRKRAQTFCSCSNCCFINSRCRSLGGCAKTRNGGCGNKSSCGCASCS